MIGRPRPADGDTTSAQLAAMQARHDQAEAANQAGIEACDAALRANRGNRAIANVCLDIRNALRPPSQGG